jgi:hypothetical protein
VSTALVTRAPWWLVIATVGLALAGCVVEDRRPTPPVVATTATTEVPDYELLDVGVRLFGANVPRDPKKQEAEEIYPEVRNAESRYIPVMIRDTLEGTGQWGQVRVLPRSGTDMDVFVDGQILKSDGRELEIDVTVSDSSGREWFRKKYQATADTRAYTNDVSKPPDPFQNVYNTLANDMLAARGKLPKAELAQLRQITQLRFDAQLAPYAFQPYLAQDRKGQWTVVRLPAEDDTMLVRLERVRERDYELIDTLNEYYTNFADSMTVPYTSWRKYSNDELEARSTTEREALTKQLLGAVAIVGGLIAGSNSNSSAAATASTAAVVGGIYAFKAGIDQHAEIKTHTESLKQLGESFQSEVKPMVVDIEGRTLELKGSAEEQYAEWQALLRQLYENEIGLPAGTAPSTATTPPAPKR